MPSQTHKQQPTALQFHAGRPAGRPPVCPTSASALNTACVAATSGGAPLWAAAPARDWLM